MRKIHVWCMGLVALFLVLGLAKATAASSHGIVRKDPDIEKLEKIPAHSLSLLRPSDIAGILLLEDQ
ncbi:hypothetical protein HMPREF2832_01865 [Streptococcus sp. HMSC073D05]|uniref:Uncharacterized protein n=1 Tax=Streptococcus parasanguinis TaxID=1318 RepID=A0A943SSW1_STRPA|nr:hypothetical protein [Streptococcus sp. HMSC073D05]MBS6536090.1 hypothetical protein [Streptococcus parasanguinis]MBS6718187.1 hypothetical protein [Streptococcus parasanguinis]OFK07433.1 hypothetical protein HMPREF2832_01865 [Streptococcus sp. HMSC073D05]